MKFFERLHSMPKLINLKLILKNWVQVSKSCADKLTKKLIVWGIVRLPIFRIPVHVKHSYI